MHPLVGPVLLGTGRQNPLVLQAQPDPPHVELGEAVDARGGEGDAVVGANSARQPVLAKEAIEDGADALALGGEQGRCYTASPRIGTSSHQSPPRTRTQLTIVKVLQGFQPLMRRCS